MRFKVGQQVVCTHSKGWLSSITKTDSDGPRFNEIVTVHSYPIPESIIVTEYRYDRFTGIESSFPEDAFEPLISDEQLSEQVNEILSKSETLEKITI